MGDFIGPNFFCSHFWVEKFLANKKGIYQCSTYKNDCKWLKQKSSIQNENWLNETSPLYSSKKGVCECEANKGLLNQLRQKICRKTAEIKKKICRPDFGILFIPQMLTRVKTHTQKCMSYCHMYKSGREFRTDEGYMLYTRNAQGLICMGSRISRFFDRNIFL